MTALGVVLLQTLCCLGFGAAALRALKIDADLDTGQHWALSFATGFGVLGWLIFPLGIGGYLSAASLTALLTAGALAAVLLRRPNRQPREYAPRPGLNTLGKVLLILLGVVGVFDLMEGIAPPADADTTAYHFVVAKQFLEAGRIEFIFEPIVGAVPFGVQMTYMPALALGGEKALTLWTMVSGWAAGALLFVLCRSHIGFNWSLAVTLIFLTMPAVIYGGGTGQVEPRTALYVMTAAWAVSRAWETGRIGYAVLAGMGAGFFAAAKYTGLLFIAVSGLVLVLQRRWLSHGIFFGAAFLAAGFQWYAWNAIHTGDPVFPMLYQWLVQDEHAWWTKAYDLKFKEWYFAGENPLPRSLFWLLAYPIKATLSGAPLPDAGRVNFGIYGLLVFPFAALGLWRFRDRVRRSPLLPFALLALSFYILWFFFGGSQRIRHLLPVLPLFLICVTVAAERLTAGGAYRKPLMASAVAVVVLQMAGNGLFALNYVKFLTQDTSREAFLNRNVNAYAPIPWINANLKKTDRILIQRRQLQYYLEVPNFFGSFQQMEVEYHPGKADARSLYRQLRRAGITHFLLSPDSDGDRKAYSSPMNLLDEAGCLVKLKSFKAKRSRSRTLPSLSSQRPTLDVLRLGDEGCLR